MPNGSDADYLSHAQEELHDLRAKAKKVIDWFDQGALQAYLQEASTAIEELRACLRR